ncbi:CD59 glycoprotein [Xiphophorus hellerii]|uniref:CD59 glycoprotein n=1 Tax=Xiphophorus hellerii TaxID=8084 RepID=UPI0013B40912|nr:CD59 glycoprotein [Xiphophorus hellerii]
MCRWLLPVGGVCAVQSSSQTQFLLLILTRTVLLLLLGETLSCAEVKMKRSLVICLLVCSSLVGLGSAIRCYSCKDYTASCTKQRDCSYDDACLTLVERGGMTYRKCLKYTECERSRLAQMFPQVSSFTFRCCNSDLCNSAPSSAAGSVIGLLASVLVMWWCVH